MSTEPYANARAMEMVIKPATQAAHEVDPSVSVDERIRQATFDRLLCRVFSEGSSSEWVLKGGTGMFARVPNARATKDIDLFVNGYTVQAVCALKPTQLERKPAIHWIRLDILSRSYIES